MALPTNDKAELSAHTTALKRFNAWEKDNPHEMGERESLAAVGTVYSLTPPEYRKTVIDPSGICAMHLALSYLESP